MSNHVPQYLNGTVLGPVTALWPHLFQARQFQGKGDARFDVTLVLNPEQQATLQQAIQDLAVTAFPNGEYNRTGAVEIEGVAPPSAFQWPYIPVLGKPKSPKLAETFPGHFVISAKAFQDSPPEIMIPNSANPGTYIPMPEGQRPQLVFDGAQCYAGVDFATYENGDNVGIRAQLNFIVFYGAGEKVAIGARPDANQGMAGISVAMQQPAGMAQAGAQGAGGMAVQGVVQAQPGPGGGAVATAQVAQPAAQVAPAQTYQLPDGTPCNADGSVPVTPQVDFTG